MSILRESSVEVAMASIFTLESDVDLYTAIKKMDEKDLEHIVVMEGGRPLKIITQRDVIALVATGLDVRETPIRDVVTKPLTTIDQSATIATALRMMEEKNVKTILVTKDGNAVGIIDSQRIRSLNLIDALSIFTISAHSHYTPYLYTKITNVYEQLLSRLRGETDIPRIVDIIRDELRKQDLVDDISVEQDGEELKIRVKDCMYSRTIHPFIEEGKEVCVLGLLTAMILQKVTGRMMRFVDFSDITETDSETRLIVKK